MRASIFFFAVLLCVASVKSQDAIRGLLEQVLESDQGKAFTNPLPDQACKDFGNAFLKACTIDTATTSGLKDDLAAAINLVSDVTNGEALRFDGNGLSGYVPGATLSEQCCTAACQVAKKGCLCVYSARQGMDTGFSLNSDGGLQAVLSAISNTCRSNSGTNFDPTLATGPDAAGPTCSQQHYDSVVSAYSCQI